MRKVPLSIAHSLAAFNGEPKANCEWVVLCDGKKTQIFEHKKQHPQEFTALFDSPINAAQLNHELEWHYSAPQKQISGHIMDALPALLMCAYYQGYYDFLTLVAPEHIICAIKQRLPEAVHSRIIQSIEKDLTHCPKEAIASYFSSLH